MSLTRMHATMYVTNVYCGTYCSGTWPCLLRLSVTPTDRLTDMSVMHIWWTTMFSTSIKRICYAYMVHTLPFQLLTSFILASCRITCLFVNVNGWTTRQPIVNVLYVMVSGVHVCRQQHVCPCQSDITISIRHAWLRPRAASHITLSLDTVILVCRHPSAT